MTKSVSSGGGVQPHRRRVQARGDRLHTPAGYLPAFFGQVPGDNRFRRRAAQPKLPLAPEVIRAFPQIDPTQLARAAETIALGSGAQFCVVNSVLHTAEISAHLDVLGSPFANVSIHSSGFVNRILLGREAFQQILQEPGALLKPPKMQLDRVRAILDY